MLQCTLADKVQVDGIGLHTGKAVHVELRPASVDTGVVFGFPKTSGGALVPAHVAHVVDTQLATSIGDAKGRVQTIEHLLAALRGVGLDNVCIAVDGDELPILDGSAQQWLDAIDGVGVCTQDARRRVFEILEEVDVHDGDRRVCLRPGNDFRVRAAIDFEHPSVGRQSLELVVTPESFRREIAWARTFGFLAQVEGLRRMGLIQGGSLENAVVFGPEGVLNPEGLRAKDEPIRHKILDMIGDLSLLGAPLKGTFEAERPGHALTRCLVEKVIANPKVWRITYVD